MDHLAPVDPTSALVPAQWPLIRALQFTAAYREQLSSVATTGAAGSRAAPRNDNPPR